MDDGSVLEAQMPTPQGVKVSGRLLPVDVEYFDCGECPICLVPSPSSREHVPPHSIGGNVRTLTCERSNNEFGSRFEPHLQAWYERSLGRVPISGGDVPGRRNGGEYLYRVTPTEAGGSTSFAVSFNRVFAVDWPLDPIFIRESGTPDLSGRQP
jgi:hypothetical protein